MDRHTLIDKIYKRIKYLDRNFASILNALFGQEWIHPCSHNIYLDKLNNLCLDYYGCDKIYHIVTIERFTEYLKLNCNGLNLDTDEINYIIKKINTVKSLFEI